LADMCVCRCGCACTVCVHTCRCHAAAAVGRLAYAMPCVQGGLLLAVPWNALPELRLCVQHAVHVVHLAHVLCVCTGGCCQQQQQQWAPAVMLVSSTPAFHVMNWDLCYAAYLNEQVFVFTHSPAACVQEGVAGRAAALVLCCKAVGGWLTAAGCCCPWQLDRSCRQMWDMCCACCGMLAGNCKRIATPCLTRLLQICSAL
jgi:hypothetical protein